MPQPTQAPAPEAHHDTPITIGSDPELVLYSPFTNEAIGADEFISDDDHDKPFGCDGHSSTAELRPSPTTDPLKHAQNIKNLLLKYAKSEDYKPVYDLSFYPSSVSDGIGGHIHFGHPLISWKENFQSSQEKYNYYQMMVQEILNEKLTPEIFQHSSYDMIHTIQRKVEQNRQALSHNLDMLVAFPLMFTEIPEHAIRRKSGYGHLSDFRGKDYGIEYRTTPCWMASEKLTQAVLSLAYATAYQTLEKDYKPEHNFTLIRGFSDNFTTHNTDLLKPFLSNAESEIHKLALYPKYREHINYLLYHAKRGTELLDNEIKLGWGIPFTLITQITLLTVKDLTEKVSQALAIPKSGRTNVQIHTQYVTAKSSDYMIPQIRDNINVCLNKIVEQSEQNKQAVYIFGKKREYGDVVTVNYDYNLCITGAKRRQLSSLIKAVAKTFGYAPDINVQINSNYEGTSINSRVRQVAKIGIGRAIREQPNYLSEAMIFTILLFFNNTLYQGFSVDRKTGKRTVKPIVTRTIVSQFKKNLVSRHKRLPRATDDTEEAQTEQAQRTRYTNYYNVSPDQIR